MAALSFVPPQTISLYIVVIIVNVCEGTNIGAGYADY
jgi:hypothetical protein